ncbi:hypothetical protein PVAR5_7916 [Paecilomyces variotii No. 5]|uniref:Uncharacterized protein n=1 Tax=Byssochlamys spectabilis (strain No. 5 / NBRC 109023) TaxID=1356009 RepID=V5GE39_BYSSN|nr:hypothetical protein PVAR5_7916 [Paecilomyces variotii No. 5]
MKLLTIFTTTLLGSVALVAADSSKWRCDIAQDGSGLQQQPTCCSQTSHPNNKQGSESVMGTDSRALALEISATRGLLTSLSDIAALDSECNDRLREVVMADHPLQLLENLLRKLEANLETRSPSRLSQIGRKIAWPFRLQESEEMMDKARRVRSLLAEALALDHL